VTIADRNGMVLARIPFPERFVGTRIPEEYLKLLTAMEPGTLEVLSQDGTDRVLGYEPIMAARPVYVSAGISTAEAFAEVNRLTLTGLATLLISIGAAVVAANWVGNRFILLPISSILGTPDRDRSGDHTARTVMSGDFELDKVGKSLDNLFDQLDIQRFKLEETDQKRALLARELSHRAKNTLTIVGAIARQTFKTQPDAVNVFHQRIQAIGGGYDVLLAGEGQSTDLKPWSRPLLRRMGTKSSFVARCQASKSRLTRSWRWDCPLLCMNSPQMPSSTGPCLLTPVMSTLSGKARVAT
jgi:hypothetical protein